MKRAGVMRAVKIAAAVVLVLSLAANIFLINRYNAYIERCTLDSEETISAVRSFETISEYVSAIASGEGVDEGELRWLQENVAVTCHKFINYAGNHDLEFGSDYAEYDVFSRFSDLKDIVFKLNELDADDIAKALDRRSHVEYLEKLSEISRDFLAGHYGEDGSAGEIGPSDGEEFYRHYMEQIKGYPLKSILV